MDPTSADPFEKLDPREMSPAILVVCLHGHWAAWWQEIPHIAFGGASPAEAVDRLHAADAAKIRAIEETW